MQRAALLRLRPLHSIRDQLPNLLLKSLALLPVILHLFLIMQTTGGMSFEDGIDARALCQVHFRDLLTSRWLEYKGYVTSELN